VRFPASGKGPGYQYPDAVVADGELLVVYSIGKEDIGVTRLKLPRPPGPDSPGGTWV
jgi:hypothetical protein